MIPNKPRRSVSLFPLTGYDLQLIFLCDLAMGSSSLIPKPFISSFKIPSEIPTNGPKSNLQDLPSFRSTQNPTDNILNSLFFRISLSPLISQGLLIHFRPPILSHIEDNSNLGKRDISNLGSHQCVEDFHSKHRIDRVYAGLRKLSSHK